jgi:RNA polymerase sigma-70 factor (ECF subfamily)
MAAPKSSIVSVLMKVADPPRLLAEPSDTRGSILRVSFREVFEAECGYVWTTLRRLGVAERDIEDVAHDTFLRVAAHLHEFDPDRALRPWLFIFVLRSARDYRRLARNRHETVGVADDTPQAGAVPADEAVAARESHALVMRALDALDWNKRVVFVACELEEREVGEVAATLGIPRNTAASRLRIARSEFTAAIRRLAARGGRP